MNARRAVLVIAPAMLLATCGEPPTGPAASVAGELTIELTAPSHTDGALLLVVHGPGPFADVSAASPGAVLHSRAAGDSVRVAVFGSIAPGPLLRFRVPDVGRVSAYRAALREVSDETNALVPSLAAYSLRISR